jgi:hypothetical protein
MYLKKKHLAMLIILITLLISCKQKNTFVKPKMIPKHEISSAKKLNDFIPLNYSILDSTYGNINLDEYLDLVLILKLKNEDSIDKESVETPLRPCLILSGEENNKFKLITRNDKLILCVGCGGIFGDPYSGTEIKNGVFTLNHYGGSNWKWTKNLTYKFKKKDKHIYLETIEEASYNVLNIEDENENIDNYIEKNTKRKTQKDFGLVKFEDYFTN